MGGEDEHGNYLDDVYVMNATDSKIEKIFQGGPIKFASNNKDSARLINNTIVAFVEDKDLANPCMIEFSSCPNSIAIIK